MLKKGGCAGWFLAESLVLEYRKGIFTSTKKLKKTPCFSIGSLGFLALSMLLGCSALSPPYLLQRYGGNSPPVS